MVARGADGETRAFPVVETVHRDSICWVTETLAAPPPGPAEGAEAMDAAADLHTRVAQLAEAAVKGLAGEGARCLNECATGCRPGDGSSFWQAGAALLGTAMPASVSSFQLAEPQWMAGVQVLGRCTCWHQVVGWRSHFFCFRTSVAAR